MAPLPPSTTTTTYYSHPRSLRRRQDERDGGSRKSPLPPHRSASFHGRTTVTASPMEHRQMQRPKTQQDLLAGGTKGMAASPDEKRLSKDGDKGCDLERRMPAKVLVNVTVQRSLGPVQVMASTEWTVGDLVAAALRQYAKEGRRPPLPTTETSAFGLHYSQFSLEPLDVKEKIIGLGSRNFFLCSKLITAISDSAPASSSSSTSTSSAVSSSCAEEAQKASKISITWLRFMDFLL